MLRKLRPARFWVGQSPDARKLFRATREALPSAVGQFISYLAKHPQTPMNEIIEPYIKFEAALRRIYAQHPDHEIVNDGHVNSQSIFADPKQKLAIRARNPSDETEEEKSKYIMPLNDGDRRSNGAPAVASSLEDFRDNLSAFAGWPLRLTCWDNVVVAGGAVTAALLPSPEGSVDIGSYYRERYAPDADVDLFMYGLTSDEACEKILSLEKDIKEAIRCPTLTIRTKYAITIVSQYPIRHVQIVLRLYGSISEILTGFDIDCACAAYSGTEVYASPRAIAALSTQSNVIDLSRRSPSFESRLDKYRQRGFEVLWPELDRTRICPGILDQPLARTQGLAKLLVMERLGPTQRKSSDSQQISSYYTMSIPYGPGWNAAKIRDVLERRDKTMNSTGLGKRINIHRHLCFVGIAEEVLGDCCGSCPETKAIENRHDMYVRGGIEFLADDPGRQAIGSFHPLTDRHWTKMAYNENGQLVRKVSKPLRHMYRCIKRGLILLNSVPWHA